MTEAQERLKIALKGIFGYEDYHNELQQKAAESIWEAKRDVFIRGFGKSIGYQLPVMIKDNCFIIVISARISYIKTQQNYLNSKRIKTNYLTSNTSRKIRNTIEKDIISEKSQIKILFVTPLKYESGYFKTLLKKINRRRLFYIVIDQADNIVSDHKNLRRQYQNLDLKIACVPIVVLSTAASFETQKDIIQKFGLLNPKIYAMPVLRTNLYYDTWYIDTLSDPVAHLIRFIEKCFRSNNDTNSVGKESWGLIVCKDLETTISIAKYFTSIGIPALPHYPNKDKNKNLENIRNVKVITVCEDVNILTVTNGLVKIIAEKLVKFIVYWYVLPKSIQKYYFQSSQARCFYDMSYCRVYCQLEELVTDCAQSSCVNCDTTGLKNNLIQIKCRHKFYSEYCGDKLYACGRYCDVCKEKEEVKEKMSLLLEITNDSSLHVKKLQETLHEFSRHFIKARENNLQLECTKQIVPSMYQIKSNINATAMKSTNFDPSLRKNLQHDEKNINKRNKLQAVSALDEIYKKLYGTQQSTQTFTLSHGKVSNITTQNSIRNINFEKSVKTRPVIEHYVSKNTITRNAVSYLNDFDNQIKNKIDSNIIDVDEEHSSRKLLRCNDKRLNHESTKNNSETKIKTIETITIDYDESNEKEGCSAQDKTKHIKKVNVCNNNKNDDDIIFIEEVRLSNKKRHRSTVKDSTSSPTSLNRNKRRKL